MADEALKAAIDAEFWLPAYRDYQKKVNWGNI
jgi:hypothetical protein